MRLLLDTHIVIALAARSTHRLGNQLHMLLTSADSTLVVSIVSFWEITIKSRLGKLSPGFQPEDLGGILRSMGVEVVPILESHVLASYDPPPLTHDPFDRLLLSTCRAEDMRLVTVDRALVGHPLAVPHG